MSDDITMRFDTTPEFDKGIAALIHSAGLNAKEVVEKESGELIKTLVRISPPQDPGKTKKNISEKVTGKFQRLGDTGSNYDALDVKPSHTGLKYYSSNSKFLFAGAADSDMRKSDESQLLQIYYRTRQVQRNARIVVPFKNRRTTQRVAILTRVITTPEQVKSLVDRLQSHVGRLKAGWLVAVWQGAIRLRGTYQPPKWVTRHRQGARGAFINHLNATNAPQFTIINSAKGVTSKVSTYFLSAAMSTRAKAMQKNALLFMSGKKSLSDYNRGQLFKV